jgi:hypothetical protein
MGDPQRREFQEALLERLKRGARVEVKPVGATRLPHARGGAA